MASEIAKLLQLDAHNNTNLAELLSDYFCDEWEDLEKNQEKTDSEDEDEFDPSQSVYDSVLNNEACEDIMTGEIDVVEWELARKFSCTCKYFNGQPCYRQFVPEELVNRRMQMKEMTAREQMLVLLGKISCSIHMGELTECSKKKEQTVRQHQKTYYWLEGKQICRATFKFLHSISNDRLSSLLKHYKANGLEPLEKKSGGRKNNTKSFSFEDAKRTVQFMTNYASENALVLPGRVPGFKRDDILLLPSSHTRVFVYSCYHNSLENTGHRIMGQSSFFELWRKLCPFIITAKPMSDLCWICQNNNNLIYRSANLNDNAKSERVKRQEDHLLIVQRERLAYNQLVDTAKQTCRDNGLVSLGLNLPCSKNIRMHYSFDYAQQVHLPSNPLQPGPIYFLVPRKVGIFGVCCEGIPRQVNFLIDEAHLISKGSNAVVSYLDFFFRNYGLGETDVDLHCDNCSGQNKNRFVLWYCAWQVATGLHRSISLHFLIAGHTKFAPDWCFGLLKKAFRRHVVPSLSVLEDVVNGSASVNQAQVTGRENGLTEVPVFDWHQFFNGTCKPVPGIKKYQHFRFDAEYPGFVFVKCSSESEEIPFEVLLPGMQFPVGHPTVIAAPGLPLARQQTCINRFANLLMRIIKTLCVLNQIFLCQKIRTMRNYCVKGMA